LIERAELQRHNIELVEYIKGNVRLPEDEEPTGIPYELFNRYDANMARLEELVRRINLTNASAKMKNGKSITEAMARRDCLSSMIRAYKEIYGWLTSHFLREFEGGGKYVRHANYAELRDKINHLSQEFRVLDTAIQALNWAVELSE
jgi:exonuclease VII small subunit